VFEELIAPYERITLDVGTGDGLFIYHCARQDPQTFFIGIDANRRPLQKISERIHRKPSKGGLPNILFAQSAVETLPDELEGIANEVYINFPWGSLLRAVAIGDETVLRKLRCICAPNALLWVVVGLDDERDRTEIDRLKLPPLSSDYVNANLVAKYYDAGFEILETVSLSPAALPELRTSWARRLQRGSTRTFIRIVARAIRTP
jgi:16S rRNA (adenine(1408)-N(1))-methyltransferase